MATGSLLATRSTILAPTDTRSCSRADHWQRLEATHIEIAPSGHRATRFEASERTPNGADRQLTFEPRQGRTQAEMRALSERQVAVVCSADIQPIGVIEHVGIAVGRANHWCQELASAYRTAPDLHVGRGSSAGGLYWRIEP